MEASCHAAQPASGADLRERRRYIELTATRVEGPGGMFAYLTETFGDPAFSVDTRDGIDEADATRLPPAAHTHMSWAFTEPGLYEATFDASVEVDEDTRVDFASPGAVRFAVGIDSCGIEGAEDAVGLDGGHADLTANLDAPGGAIEILYDEQRGEASTPSRTWIRTT
ncbi:choice-of-anchor M domain-containing protein [Microbacterium sp. gxy059]|uniref:choice-of-anchor M domain-containing protein n=1 Tax=Microbacterium sp. gxy059 TaxID=2957199 RepID=UPI003D974FEF